VFWRGNEVRFFADPKNGAMALVEMFSSSFDYPCEVYFYEKTMEVRHNVHKPSFAPLIFGIFETETLFGDGRQRTAAGGRDQAANEVTPDERLHVDREARKVIDEASQKVVKIYGAKGAGIHGFQSGIIISPEGHILTALTSALQVDPIVVVLDNGRKYDARLSAADPVMEIALLKIPVSDLPFFDIDGKRGELGTPVYAISNPFNIAQGNERATVQRGAIAALAQLSARRGVFETPYKGNIIVVDVTTNNPGSCGGALISAESGELLGILGKELRNNENHSWLNFAIPTYVWDEPVRKMKEKMIAEGERIPIFTENWDRKVLIPEDTIKIFQDWGILFVTSVSRRTPPFIDSVLPDSAAAKLGVLSDDLIVMVNGQLTASLAAVEYYIHQIPADKPVTLTIERDATLREVEFPR
jgi:serine protease Do